MTWNYFLSHCRILEYSLKTRRNLVRQSLQSSNQKRDPRRDRTQDGELAHKDYKGHGIHPTASFVPMVGSLTFMLSLTKTARTSQKFHNRSDVSDFRGGGTSGSFICAKWIDDGKPNLMS